MTLSILILFCLSIFASAIFKFSILISMSIGLILFVSFAFIKRFSVKEIVKMSFEGIKTTKNILLLLILLGFLTATWRASGTIAFIISLSSILIHPKIFILVTFLLNCLISTLSGTAFGTAATMGTICMTFAMTSGINEAWTGGAILSGVYFGNRISPISSIALLTSSITKTNIYSNIKKIMPSTIFPFFVTCSIYFVMGFFFSTESEMTSNFEIFKSEFNLNYFCLIPAIIILVLSILKVPVSLTLLISVITAFFVSFSVQDLPFNDLLKALIFGFKPKNQELVKMISGGGFLSMTKVLIIVLLASIYGGIFKKTKMLDSIKERIKKMAKKTNNFIAILFTSVITSMIVCNQTLTIITTHQLCDSLEENEKLAVKLFNSAVVIPPLIPWSVAAMTALSSAKAPIDSVIFAHFLYLLPLSTTIFQIARNHKNFTYK